MMTGTHDPLRSIRADYPDVAMVTADDGALIPARLAGRESGWQGDRSHDEGFSERLSALYARMDELTEQVAEWHRTGEAQHVITTAGQLATAWRKIRKELNR